MEVTINCPYCSNPNTIGLTHMWSESHHLTTCIKCKGLFITEVEIPVIARTRKIEGEGGG